MKSEENWELMMSAAKQYYQLNLSQDVIARNLFISKSTVSRLIKKAVDMGYIEFKINSFGEVDECLQHEFSNCFHIECHIIPTLINADMVQLNDICAYAAPKICNSFSDGETICVPFGKTMEYLAANITEPIERYKNLKICMLNGFVNGSIHSMRAIHIIEKMSDMLGAAGYVLPCPLLAATPEMKQIFLTDPSIREVCDLSEKADTIIFSVGPFDMHNTYLTELGENVVKHLRQFNGAGNFAGRSYDINGKELKTNLCARLMSPTLEEIAKKKKRICIAVGDYKVMAVLGLLRGGIINCLYTDSRTAKRILQEQNRLKNRIQTIDY